MTSDTTREKTTEMRIIRDTDARLLARRDDKETSKTAARLLRSGTTKAAMLSAFADGRTYTADEANLRCDGRGGRSYWHRCTDLVRDGYLRESGVKYSYNTNREQTAYEITEAGRQMLREIEEK